MNKRGVKTWQHFLKLVHYSAHEKKQRFNQLTDPKSARVKSPCHYQANENLPTQSTSSLSLIFDHSVIICCDQ